MSGSIESTYILENLIFKVIFYRADDNEVEIAICLAIKNIPRGSIVKYQNGQKELVSEF